MRVTIAVLAVVAMMGVLGQGVEGYTNPCNQQKGTYYPKFQPKAVSEYMTITPFFSPSGSTPTLTKMVEEAQDVRHTTPYPHTTQPHNHITTQPHNHTTIPHTTTSTPRGHVRLNIDM